MDKILRIDMGADGGPKASESPVGDYAGLGGRALTSAVVSKEVPPLCHPLGEDNKLVIAPGLLSGTAAAMSGRISIGCKSPLTGGIKESNAGGQAAQVLARLGYAAIILEGLPKADALYKVFINKDGVTITEDNSLKMLGNYALVEKLTGEYGDKVAFVSIGQAGEMKMAAASIACTDMELRPTRHAGRGGTGAVMGSKGVKAIVLDDAGLKNRAPKDADAFKDAKTIIVLDRALSFGGPGGPVCSEIRSALYPLEKRPKVVSFVGGLGGRDISVAGFEEIVSRGIEIAKKGSSQEFEIFGVRE